MLRAGGPTPKHIAIVMDGNRRFAKSRSMHRARGHEHGADKLVEVLEWCLALGVEALSVYAFSTDNLKRDDEEVAGLFALAERRLLELAASDVIREKRVRVRVLGEVFSENKANAIPAGLRAAAARVTASTWHHEGPVLNVCFAYTGREDIAQAVGALGAAARAGDLAPNDVTDDALERCLRGAAFDAAKQTGVVSCSRNAAKQTSVSKTEHDRDHRVVRRTALDDALALGQLAHVGANDDPAARVRVLGLADPQGRRAGGRGGRAATAAFAANRDRHGRRAPARRVERLEAPGRDGLRGRRAPRGHALLRVVAGPAHPGLRRALCGGLSVRHRARGGVLGRRGGRRGRERCVPRALRVR